MLEIVRCGQGQEGGKKLDLKSVQGLFQCSSLIFLKNTNMYFVALASVTRRLRRQYNCPLQLT